MSFHISGLAGRTLLAALGTGVFCVGTASLSRGQGPTPETGATLFPGGAYISYNSIITTRRLAAGTGAGLPITARPTFMHEVPLTFAWGFRRDFQLTVVVPIVNTRFETSAADRTNRPGGTGLGDILVLLKYRLLRLDSERGTTQASFTFGPKLPAGRTSLRDASGARLPADLQPGSGSTDLFFNLSATYTGLFHIKRLVADESITYLWRRQGSQQTQLGSTFESRFWLPYRPYQTRSVDKEWFIGPALTWLHGGQDRQAGIPQAGSASDVLLLGATTYVGVRRGLVVWIGADFPVAQTASTGHTQIRHRFSLGITQQFRLHQ